MEVKYDLIVTIVNRGFSQVVMDAARAAGATGGTILHGKGSIGSKELEHFYNIVLQEEKEAVLIVTSKETRNAIMDAILHAANLASEAHGITFSLPVEDFVLLKKQKPVKEEE